MKTDYLLLVVQRLVVALSCVAFYALLTRPMLPEDGRTGMFVGLIILACIEKLCSIMNLVSVEKDWVSNHNRDRREQKN